MNKSAAAILLVLLTLPVTTIAAQAQANGGEVTKEDWTFMVNTLADCAGMYFALADASQAINLGQSSRAMHELANGWQVAAFYALTLGSKVDASDKGTDASRRRYVQGRVDTSKHFLQSAIELQNDDALKVQSQKCDAFSDLQKELVQQVRDIMAGRSP